MTPPRPPMLGLRNLPKFQEGLAAWRIYVAFNGGFGLLVAFCGGGIVATSPQGLRGLLFPMSFLLLGVPGFVLFVVSLGRGANAIDIASWSVSQPGLANAQHYSWAASLLLFANLLALPTVVLVQSDGAWGLLLVLFMFPVAVVLFKCSILGGVFGWQYQRLAHWHRVAPPEALRPLNPDWAAATGQAIFPPYRPKPGAQSSAGGWPTG